MCALVGTAAWCTAARARACLGKRRMDGRRQIGPITVEATLLHHLELELCVFLDIHLREQQRHRFVAL